MENQEKKSLNKMKLLKRNGDFELL